MKITYTASIFKDSVLGSRPWRAFIIQDGDNSGKKFQTGSFKTLEALTESLIASSVPLNITRDLSRDI
jgi:hypothetical protein|tara:strand:+ start:714 stop:917 length:204 start_codon:yes stop_codon:yes gene_type:complete